MILTLGFARVEVNAKRLIAWGVRKLLSISFLFSYTTLVEHVHALYLDPERKLYIRSEVCSFW